MTVVIETAGVMPTLAAMRGIIADHMTMDGAVVVSHVHMRRRQQAGHEHGERGDRGDDTTFDQADHC